MAEKTFKLMISQSTPNHSEYIFLSVTAGEGGAFDRRMLEPSSFVAVSGIDQAGQEVRHILNKSTIYHIEVREQ